ncbi:trypsin-3-like [Wyeomyia smithii]|uniref:trypsin-3-like n=1 Tax=Wyeomyia smithii TaxID=174621 RepID=UPI0024680BF4|nr:trypsin-3-like [Wyeomyia smithii]
MKTNFAHSVLICLCKMTSFRKHSRVMATTALLCLALVAAASGQETPSTKHVPEEVKWKRQVQQPQDSGFGVNPYPNPNPLQDGYYVAPGQKPPRPNEGHGLPAMSDSEMSTECAAGPRMAGAVPASWDEASFQASLRDLRYDRNYFYGSGHFCGGAIISERVVISAASCFTARQADKVGVVVGTLNRRKEVPGITQLLYVNKLLPHSQHSRAKSDNDIGLVILKTNVRFGANISPIPLPYYSRKAGAKCHTFGWGKATKSQSYFTDCMQQATAIVRDWNECKRKAHQLNIELSKTSLCAGSFEGGVNNCITDFGGPLVCEGVLCGIASDKVGCDESGMTKIYTDVFKNMEWIENTMKTHSKRKSLGSLVRERKRNRKDSRGRQDEGAEGGVGRQTCSVALLAVIGLYALV